MNEILELFFQAFWNVLAEMAPFLLLGYLLAGMLSVLVTPDTIHKHLGGNRFASILKAALFGMPLPLCSCSVIPVTASLRKGGAGRGAVASFLISTPTTGVDSIMASWALLGPVFAIYRAAMSVILGMFSGIMVNIFGGKDEEYVAKEGECSIHGTADCDCEELNKPQGNVLLRILRYGFITIPRDLGKPLLIGVLVASLIAALIDARLVEQFLGSGIGTMLLMLVIGIPLYVCATASIPLALGFMALGASPGAAFVFLVAGPVTNAATLAILWRMIGKRPTIIMLLSIFVGALAGGIALDLLWDGMGIPAAAEHVHEHEHSSLLDIILVVIFVAVQLWAVYRKRLLSLFSGGRIEVVDSCCEADHEHGVATDDGGVKAKVEVDCCSEATASKVENSCREPESNEKSACPHCAQKLGGSPVAENGEQEV